MALKKPSTHRLPIAVALAAALALWGCSRSDTPSGSVPALAATQAAPAAGKVAVYLTTADLKQTLARQADLTFSSDGSGAGTSVTIDDTQKFQTLTAGFGVALTDTSAYLLKQVLPPAVGDSAMAALFSPSAGIGLSYVRLGMGGTDYNVSEQPYTYDDLPAGETDPQLQSFSVDHDRAAIIPAAQQARRLNPDVVYTTSPWSPPAWMKTDGQLIPTPVSMLKPEAFEPWAQYFVKFVKAYAAAGIHFDHISIQNEPLNPLVLPGIPGMLLPPTDAITFINDHLAPAFASNGISSKIMIWDFFWEVDATYIPLTMAAAGKNVGALAYHCYLSDPFIMTTYQALYGLPQYETECSSKLDNIEPAQMTIRSLNNWAQGVQLWNAALDPQGGPKFGSGCQGEPGTTFAGEQCTAPIVVDPKTRSYSFTADFWALAHFSRFIRNGAHRIASNGLATCYGGPAPLPCGLEGTAFENTDGTQVLVLTTNNGQAATFTLNVNGQQVTATVPDSGIATLVWRKPT